MNTFIYCVLVLFKCIIMNRFVSGEYHIKDNVVPSYLYFKFDDIKNEFFPHDIRLNISLSKIAGTLLYSIDNKGHQMIVTLKDVNEPMIQIEINKQVERLSLPELCRCYKCRYEILDMHINVGSHIKIKCNGGKTKQIEYTKKLDLNKGYPIMYNASDSKGSSKHEAHLWVGNTPRYNDVYPNNEQVDGCIYFVSYNGHSIKFINITSNVATKCPHMCFNNIHEMEYDLPVCNCKGTFVNERYCNNKMVPMNKNISSEKLMLNMFMVWWNSSVEKIHEINSTSLRLALKGLNKRLIFEYETFGMEKNETTLCYDYVPSNTYICVMTFNETSIDIKLYNNGYWDTVTVGTTRDIMKETFRSVSLCSGYGTIDFMFKTIKNDGTWRRIGVESTKCNIECTPYNMSDFPKENPIYNLSITNTENNKSITNTMNNLSTTNTENNKYITCTQLQKVIISLEKKVNWILGIVIALIVIISIILVLIIERRFSNKRKRPDEPIVHKRSPTLESDDTKDPLVNGHTNTPV